MDDEEILVSGPVRFVKKRFLTQFNCHFIIGKAVFNSVGLTISSLDACVAIPYGAQPNLIGKKYSPILMSVT